MMMKHQINGKAKNYTRDKYKINVTEMKQKQKSQVKLETKGERKKIYE